MPSLSFGISFLETSSLDTLFSSHPILLTRFLYYFVLQSLHKSTSQYYFVLQILRKVLSSTTSYNKAFTKYTSQYYFVLQSLHKILPSTPSYYKACTKYFPVLLHATKLAQSASQYYFVLQSLHKQCFPGRLRTTKLAQNTSPYYFVLQSLHKVLPSTTSNYIGKYSFVLHGLHRVLYHTTSYYKACTKYFPVLLRTTKLAQSISPYYFFLQSLHKLFPGTTSHYKACTKYFPVLLHTLKLAQKVLPTFVTPERQPHETRFPPSTPGASFFEKTQGLVRFLQSKHHLDTAVPLRSALPALQITLQLHRAPFCAPPFCSLHIRTLPHPYSLTSLLCPSPISAHPYSLHL